MGGAKQERIQPPHPFPSCQAEGLSSWGPQSSSSSSDALTRALAGDTTAQASARSAASASPGWAQCSAFPSPHSRALSAPVSEAPRRPLQKVFPGLHF